MTTLCEWKNIFKNIDSEKIRIRLRDVLEDIGNLEKMYMTGSPFSQTFKDAAYRERQAQCQLSSACYSILRERGIEI